MKTILLQNNITPSQLGNRILFAAKEGDSHAYGYLLSGRRNKTKNDCHVENKNENFNYIRALQDKLEVTDPNGILRNFISYIFDFVVQKTKDVMRQKTDARTKRSSTR